MGIIQIEIPNKCFKCQFCITPYHTVCTLYERDTVSNTKPEFCKATHVTVHEYSQDSIVQSDKNEGVKIKLKSLSK